MTAGNGREFSYDAFDRTSSVEKGETVTSFVYDCDDDKLISFSEALNLLDSRMNIKINKPSNEKKKDSFKNLIKEIEGETVKGDKYIEFYPDAESVKETVVELFYTPQN